MELNYHISSDMSNGLPVLAGYLYYRKQILLKGKGVRRETKNQEGNFHPLRKVGEMGGVEMIFIKLAEMP